MEGGVPDVLREIWRDDFQLLEEIPATDDPTTNRFFEDGLAHFSSASDIPQKFVTIEDFGDLLRTRASGKLEERKASFIIRVSTGRKALTRFLVRTYLGQIERKLSGSVCDAGSICDYVLESQQFSELPGGFRLWRGQLTVVIRTRRPWQTRAVAHA